MIGMVVASPRGSMAARARLPAREPAIIIKYYLD
jgi:hypothetical protein